MALAPCEGSGLSLNLTNFYNKKKENKLKAKLNL